MADKIQIQYQAAKTLYFLVRNASAQVWNGSSFVTYATADYANYDVAMTEQGTASGYYVGTFPSGITAQGTYSVVVKQQAGASPAETDMTVGGGDVYWTGAALLSLTDMATSGQLSEFMPVRIFRGQMLQNFKFKLVSSADHVTPFLSGICSGVINRDNGTFAALQSGIFTEEGRGFYRVTFTSGDLLCNTASLVFTANGVSGGQADQRDFSFVLQKTSGQ